LTSILRVVAQRVVKVIEGGFVVGDGGRIQIGLRMEGGIEEAIIAQWRGADV